MKLVFTFENLNYTKAAGEVEVAPWDESSGMQLEELRHR